MIFWISINNIWSTFLHMVSLNISFSNMYFLDRWSQEWLPILLIIKIEKYLRWTFAFLNVGPDVFLSDGAPNFFHWADGICEVLVQALISMAFAF